MAYVKKLNEYGTGVRCGRRAINEIRLPEFKVNKKQEADSTPSNADSIKGFRDEAFKSFKESLVEGNVELFKQSMGQFAELFEYLYGVKNGEVYYKMQAYFTQYKIYEFTSDGKVSNRSKTYSTSPITSFNYYTTNKWSSGDRNWGRVPEVCFEFVWKCNGKEVGLSTFINCMNKKQEDFFNKIEEQLSEKVDTEMKRIAAESSFSEDTLRKYNMLGVTNYVDWLADNALSILKGNGMYDRNNFYTGLYVGDLHLSFWTGSIYRLTADGVQYAVGGDSTDEEGVILYSDWKRRTEYREYCGHAGVYCTIDYDDKSKFSKAIYDYIVELLKKGKLE